MKPLGRNKGGYFGETIDIHKVLDGIFTEAESRGWQREIILQKDSLGIFALKRKGPRATRRIYISTGIHGDEPAGPLAAQQLISEDRWPDNAEIILCPCLNPTGFERNTRENSMGLDLNRQYLNPQAPETRAHIQWLERQGQFDICLCLHEDWESKGFYVYELNPENRPSFAEAIIRNVSAVCPVDMSPVIEGREANGGIISPSLDPRTRPLWPEAFWLIMNKTRQSYTTEAPSDFPLATRVAAEVAAVRTVLEGLTD
jgi:predicted deacylase